jgi:hypothetical protein
MEVLFEPFSFKKKYQEPDGSLKQKSTANDFTAVGDNHKSIGHIGIDKIPKLDRLSPPDSGKDDGARFPGVIALGTANRCAAI